MIRFLEPPINLVLGSPIRVRIWAYNIIGTSDTASSLAPVDLQGVVVHTIPLKPELPPWRGALTNTNQVDLRWTSMTSLNQNGGSAITSYEVLWDAGTSG